MQWPLIPINEKERLAALREYDILDSEAEKDFDEITLLASEICHAQISMVTLIDSERQWFKTGCDIPLKDIPRKLSFCSHAINFPYDPMVVTDMRKDERFADHPYVTGEPHVVFYVGIPLTTSGGYAIGTLCVVDSKPNSISESQIRSLKMLANQVIQLLELRKANIRLNKLKDALEARNEELQQFAYVVSHDIKSPLASIVLTSEMLRENFGEEIDEGNDQLLKVLNRASFKIKSLVDGILTYYRAEMALNDGAETFQLNPFLLSIAEMLNADQSAEITYPGDGIRIHMNKIAFEQIMVNLIQNALKYNDKENPKVVIAFSEDDAYYSFSVTDNGKGIAPKEQEKIFELFTTLGIRDRFGTKGTGIGLSTVKRLVEKMGGKVMVKSTPDEGSEFSFSIKKEDKLTGK